MDVLLALACLCRQDVPVPLDGDPSRSALWGRSDSEHLGAGVLCFSGAGALQGRKILLHRDGDHALSGEDAATLQLPVLVLLL